EFTLEQRALERRRSFTASVDLYLILTVGVLVAIGLMMVWSTTFFWSNPQYAIFMQQVRSAGIGTILLVIVSLINYRVWRRLAIPLMGVTSLALLAVLILPGVKEIFGARRAFFDGAVQPSEIALLVVTIYMAAWLSSKQGKLRSLTYGLLPFAVLVGTVAALVILEPDLSTAALILITASVMFFLAGADWIQMGITAGVFVLGGFLAITNIDYARVRVSSWIDLLRDPLTKNAEHAQNAIIAFLNGGMTGVGLGQSYQKFHALPAPHTDSIFAVIGEELGLVGCALVIALFVILLLRGFRISRQAPDSFGALLAAGITVSLVIEGLLNIAVMAAVVPFTGVPLPFISFGGSSLVASMIGIGVLISISRVSARNAVPVRKTNETLNLPGVRGSISRVRRRPLDG
ncbi:MAG TPA: putative peptidoglycan glycosyltransferase FtsW, partial [Aggregatilineales bacterium]|nr:putative peptidoglycan glycosyltransferase FtsW [Aggregatilineales bacterium]